MHLAAKQVKQEELMRDLLTGHSLKECAVLLRLSYSTVLSYAREPEFLQKLKSYSVSIYERLDRELSASKENLMSKAEELSYKALQKLEKLMDDANTPPLVQFKAAQDVLDRDPRVSRTKRIESQMDHRFINPAVLLHAAATAKEVQAYTEKTRGELGDGSTDASQSD